MSDAERKVGLLGRILSTLADREIEDRLTDTLGQETVESIVAELVEHGFEVKTSSWTGEGPAKPISPDEVAVGISPSLMFDLTSRFALAPDEVTRLLSDHLPGAVERLARKGVLTGPA